MWAVIPNAAVNLLCRKGWKGYGSVTVLALTSCHVSHFRCDICFFGLRYTHFKQRHSFSLQNEYPTLEAIFLKALFISYELCYVTSIKLITGTTALSNSMKLWAMLCRATQDGKVIVESSDKKWSTGEGNGKPLQYSCLENPMNSKKRQKDLTLKEELPRLVGAQYATGEE